MKILTLSLYPIEIPTHGGQLRIESIVRLLRGAGHEVRTAGVQGHPTYASSRHFLKFPGNEVLKAYIKDPSLMEDWAIGQLVVHDDVYFNALAERISWKPDLIFVEQPWLFQFARRYNATSLGGRAKIIYSSQNVENVLKHSISKVWFGEAVTKDVQNKILACEIYATKNADLVFCVSDNDVAWHSKYSKQHAILAANGVTDSVASFEDIRAANALTESRKFALFCASGHPPNVTGFFDIFGAGAGCFPPGSSLIVAGGAGGSIPQSPKFGRAGGIPAVYRNLGVVKEDVLRGLLATAHVIILPITQGGGTNLKTAEAIWSGRHVVATRAALRGFEPYADSPGLTVADDAPAFLAALREKLLRPPLDLTVEERNARRGVLWERTLADLVSNISALETAE